MKIFIFITCLLVSTVTFSQDTIYIQNPSFEGIRKHSTVPKNWFDAMKQNSPKQSSPDLQPIDLWGQSPEPSDGKSYVGMVVRYDGTNESIGQKLTDPLIANQCYSMSIDLCKSKEYHSPTQRNRVIEEQFLTPAVLRVWLSNSPFKTEQLVFESEPIENHEWETMSFVLRPQSQYKYIHLQCYYKTPILLYYNGHIMIDNMSHLIKVPCK